MTKDAQGRRRPKIKEGTEFTLKIDTVIGTVGSEEKAELARTHGCDYTILYTSEEFGFMEGYGGRTQTSAVDENRVIITFSKRTYYYTGFCCSNVYTDSRWLVFIHRGSIQRLIR